MPPTDPDPLAHFTSPPPNESPTQRASRLESEAAARKISDRIDDELRAEKARLKRERVVRVLLLGQSESGKSTTLKNFRLRYARAAWDAERLAWRSVVQLNVVRSLRAVLECVQAEVDGAGFGEVDGAGVSIGEGEGEGGGAGEAMLLGVGPLLAPTTPAATTTTTPTRSTPTPTRPTTATSPSNDQHPSLAPLSNSYTSLRLQLVGLEGVERALMRRLGAGGEEDYGSSGSSGGSGSGSSGGAMGESESGGGENGEGGTRSTVLHTLNPNTLNPNTSHLTTSHLNTPGPGSAAIGGGSGKGDLRPKIQTEWGVQRLQDALVRSARGTPSPSPSPPPGSGGGSGSGSRVGSGSRRAGPSSSASGSAPGFAVQGGVGGQGTNEHAQRTNEHAHEDNPDEEGDLPTKWLSAHRGAAKALWADEGVRAVLRRRRVRVEDGAGFFLDDLDRIARQDYTPSDADVVRARLRTLGVQEYRIHFDGPVGRGGAINNDMGQDWILYDVGGSRTMRPAWVPYFDNIQAIIFLAPISCFDERLSEDSKVNRLEDSFHLFREICSSKLLAKATMVLFLNKCDLLRRKLRAGVQVRHYLPSFGSRANEVSVVVKYLREKFREVLKESSPEQRWSYFYATSVVDTEATATTISAVRDSILQNYLKKADFV